MGRYVTIFRWTAEQAQELNRRSRTLTDLTAPKEVLAALAKIKIIWTAHSPNNFFNILIYEVDEKDMVEATLVAIYFMTTCSLETYPVLNEADSLKLGEMVQKVMPNLTTT